MYECCETQTYMQVHASKCMYKLYIVIFCVNVIYLTSILFLSVKQRSFATFSYKITCSFITSYIYILFMSRWFYSCPIFPLDTLCRQLETMSPTIPCPLSVGVLPYIFYSFPHFLSYTHGTRFSFSSVTSSCASISHAFSAL